MKHLASSFPPSKAAFLALAGSLFFLAQSASATVVTSNNLSKVLMPEIQTSNNMGSFSFETDPYRIYRLEGTVASTVTGADVSGYNIMGLSKGSLPTITDDLIQYWRVRTGVNVGGVWVPQSFPAARRGFNLITGNESATYYYTLGVGRYEAGPAAFSSWNYSWSATDMYLYSAAGVQGNIVPNASFEDTSVNFWRNSSSGSASGTFVSDAGVHGSTVWEVSSTLKSYITLSVQPGVEYEYSFWSASPEIGDGHRIEYGFFVPSNGHDVTTGNSSIQLAKGNGSPKPWKEYTGTFTPGEGQTLWYLGGMANGGRIQFDSIYVAQVAAIPEPGMAALLLVGGGVLWLRRRSRRAMLPGSRATSL